MLQPMMPPPMMTISAWVRVVMDGCPSVSAGAATRGGLSRRRAVGLNHSLRASSRWADALRSAKPARVMTDAEYLAELRAGLLDGRADVAFSPGLGTHLDFPGNSETDKGQFILAGFVLMALAYWRGSWPIVGGVFILLVAVYWLFWRKVVLRRMRQRFINKVMADLKLWRKSWTFTGIKLSAGSQECLSPN